MFAQNATNHLLLSSTSGPRPPNAPIDVQRPQISVWEASMHGSVDNDEALRWPETQAKSLRLPRGWLTKCFDVAAADNPERGLRHHPARSAPVQMPRVTGVQRRAGDYRSVETYASRLPSRLAFDTPRASPWLGELFSPFSASRVGEAEGCAEEVEDLELKPRCTPQRCVPCLRSCVHTPSRSPFSTQVPSFFLGKASSAEDTASDHPALDVACRETLRRYKCRSARADPDETKRDQDKRQPAAVGRYEYDGIRHGTA